MSFRNCTRLTHLRMAVKADSRATETNAGNDAKDAAASAEISHHIFLNITRAEVKAVTRATAF